MIDAKIPTSARAWELYTSKRGCGSAANELTKALRATLREIRSNLKTSRETARVCNDACAKYLLPVMYKLEEFGASDTEPRYHARSSIVRTACNIRGWDIDDCEAHELSYNVL